MMRCIDQFWVVLTFDELYLSVMCCIDVSDVFYWSVVCCTDWRWVQLISDVLYRWSAICFIDQWCVALISDELYWSVHWSVMICTDIIDTFYCSAMCCIDQCVAVRIALIGDELHWYQRYVLLIGNVLRSSLMYSNDQWCVRLVIDVLHE